MNDRWKFLKPAKNEEEEIEDLIEQCRRNDESATIDFIIPSQQPQPQFQQSSDEQYLNNVINEIKTKLDSIFSNSSNIDNDNFHYNKKDIIMDLMGILSSIDNINENICSMCDAKNYFAQTDISSGKQFVNDIITLS